jgi:CRISPR/Cas system-associated exonuclease Cas4 (RecB family)
MHDKPDRQTSFTTERMLGAQRLAQYVSRNRCERYLRLALFPSEGNELKARYGVTFEPLSPLLSAEGQAFEREKIEELRGQAEQVADLTNRSAADFLDEMRRQGMGRAYYYQPALEGRIGGWASGGRADLIEATRSDEGAFSFVVIDIKASVRETVSFRLQVAFYAVLLEELLRENGLALEEIRGAIASRDIEFSPGSWNTFDLALFKDEINRLVAASDSDVARAAATSFSTAVYYLGSHCDGCPYNALCFVDTAEREDLSLVPHLTMTEKRALHSEGINGVRDLSRLITYTTRGVEIAPNCEAEVNRVSSHWALGARLPNLAQRARAALALTDKTIEHRRALYSSSWGSLPDANSYPDLVKVFVDAQRDHIQDRLYMLAGSVTGPRGSEKVVEMVDAVPDLENEQGLLIGWLQKLLPAVKRVADSDDAPLHVYLFDRRGQRSLLDALARHFDALCGIPAFYDLLTSTPALTQSMISFLGDEVSERQNLGAICHNLYEVATAMGFKWRDGAVNIPAKFRSRIFDNRRLYSRNAESGKFRVESEGAGIGAGVWIESAARFSTQIPLEYAYAAWGALQDSDTMKGEARAQIKGFLGTTQEDIKELASARLAALRHIEAAFRYKNRQVEKRPLTLNRLDEVETDPSTVSLHRSLEDFLRLEHYARLQEQLLHFALPPELRAQTGRTAILRCKSYDKDAKRAEFTFTDIDGNPLDATETGTVRLREGDWMTLNPVVDGETGEPPTGKRIVYGRLCVVEEIAGTRMSLKLLAMSFKNSKFRFGHRMLEPEQTLLYTIDEMADDLNADKFLEACQNAETNHLYQWLENPERGKTPRTGIRPSRLRSAEQVATFAHEAQAPHGLTSAQRKVIGGHITDRMLVLQGPPGTGKSHTLGFATLARALALATPARPFRVAVCTKTHAASLVALESIIARAKSLLANRAGGDGIHAVLEPLTQLKVFKICNDADDCLPSGIEPLVADGSGRMKAPEQWERLMREPLIVIGGTPGGLYNLVKRGAMKGKPIVWSEKYFDLVLVDEASQMGQSEALLAAAFLREDGQFIAIGDHRQMPPILAHAWDQDSRRELNYVRPHLSIFELLRELNFASAALDESFRIPAEVADFLCRHVYAADGVNFHSHNLTRLAPLGADELPTWISAALDPEHPLVVIEHAETGSQQSNEFESDLITELVHIAGEHLGLDAAHGLGVVVPHRGQKFLLRERLPTYAEAIDTVERFQGGERDLIIVSATVSDREYASAESDFLLEPRRFTVALSRPKRKVIVIASRSVFDLVPSDLDAYERGSLWKLLRHEVEKHVLWRGEIKGHAVSVRVV